MEYINLIPDFVTGDEKAFKHVFYTHYPRLMLFGCKMVNDKEKIEDVVLSIFNSLFNKCHKFDCIETIQSYLYISIRHKCLNIINEKKREVYIDKFIDLIAEEQIPEYDRTRAINKLRKALLKLPPKCRQIVELIYLEEYKPKEVADMLNVTLETIYAQQRIGLKKLKNILS